MTPDDVIVVGTLRIIAYARDASGQARARTFLEDECSRTDAVRLSRCFHLVAFHGERAARQEAFKHELGSIHAFKGHRARIAAFRSGNIWFLTHGFLKQRARWPVSQIERAERIRFEHLMRERLE
jgi:hypothetical protein